MARLLNTRRRKILAACLAVVLLVIALLIFAAREERLSISIGPVTYKKLHGGHVSTTFVITNTSVVTIEFMQFYDGQMRIDDGSGWLQLRVPPSPILEAPTVIEPGQTSTSRVTLPPNVRQWQVGYKTHSPSARAQVWRILPRNMSAPLVKLVTAVFPDTRHKDQEVWGEVFDATSWLAAQPEESLPPKVRSFEIFPPRIR